MPDIVKLSLMYEKSSDGEYTCILHIRKRVFPNKEIYDVHMALDHGPDRLSKTLRQYKKA